MCRLTESVGFSLSPGVAVDVEGVAILGEAIDEGGDARGSGEDGAPGLEREIGRDDGGSFLVPAADDVEEEVCGSRVTREISDFVQDEQARLRVSAQPALE